MPSSGRRYILYIMSLYKTYTIFLWTEAGRHFFTTEISFSEKARRALSTHHYLIVEHS